VARIMACPFQVVDRDGASNRFGGGLIIEVKGIAL